MSGKIIPIVVGQIMWSRWDNNKVEWCDSWLKPEDIYIVVFSAGQEHYKKAFESNTRYNILHKAKKAINANYRLHGPRNTLFVFELKND